MRPRRSSHLQAKPPKDFCKCRRVMRSQSVNGSVSCLWVGGQDRPICHGGAFPLALKVDEPPQYFWASHPLCYYCYFWPTSVKLINSKFLLVLSLVVYITYKFIHWPVYNYIRLQTTFGRAGINLISVSACKKDNRSKGPHILFFSAWHMVFIS